MSATTAFAPNPASATIRAAASIFVSSLLAVAVVCATTVAAQRPTVYPPPVINDMTPHEGSVLGGTRITFTGEWFGDSNADVTIMIGADDADAEVTPCHRVAFYSSETRLVCQTEAFHVRKELPVRVVTRGMPASCTDRNGCNFRFTEDATPEVSSTAPGLAAGASVLSMSGRDFSLGDENVENRDFDVRIGGERCPKQDLPFSSGLIQCHATAANRAGAHRLSVTLSSRGVARLAPGADTVLVVPTVTGVRPARGSTEGGQTITISGSGFQPVPSRNLVTVHGAPCAVTAVQHDALECVTSPHADTTAATSASTSGAEGLVRADYYRSIDAQGDVWRQVLGHRHYLQPTATKQVAQLGGVHPFPEENYGAVRYTTLFVPNATGVYRFQVRGDDVVELWLSTGARPVPYERTQLEEEDPFNAQRIAFTSRHRSSWDSEESQTSDDVTLTSGAHYWLRVFVKNNGGASGVDVRVTLPSGGVVTNPTGSMVRLAPEDSSYTPINVTSAGGLQAQCAGACLSSGAAAYDYDASATTTPTVTSVTGGSSVSAGASITIDGTGFDANGDNVVSAGGVPCVLVSTSATQIVCSFAAAPPGTADLRVRVGTLGEARGAGTVTGTIAVSSVSPTTGSISGGTTMTVAGSGFGSAADALTVDVGGSACTVTDVRNDRILCTTTAHAAGSATVTVTRNRGTTAASSAVHAVAFHETRPQLADDAAAPKARVITKSVRVSGGLVEIDMPEQNFKTAADATVMLVTETSSVACPTQVAVSAFVTCQSPYHPPAASANVTVNGVVVGAIAIREEVTYVDGNVRFGPNGGNYARIRLDRHGRSRNVSVSVGGAPCEALRWSGDSDVYCYGGARPGAATLPSLFNALADPATAATQLAEAFHHDGASVTADGVVYLPAGKFLATKTLFDKPIVFTAHVRPTLPAQGQSSSDSCVYMRAFPADPAARDSGLVGYAGRNTQRFGLGTSGTRGWMPDGIRELEAGTITENIGLDPNAWQEWKLEVRPRGARFFVNGVELVNDDGFTAAAKGTVGFGHSCQAIAVKNITVLDLTPGSLQVSIDGRAVDTTDREIPITQATSAVVNSISSTSVFGGDSVSFQTPSVYSTWRLSAHALETGSNSPAMPVDQVEEFCSGFSYLPETTTLRCTVNSNLAAGTYTVRLRDSYGGYVARSFTVTVNPTVSHVTPRRLPPAGGFVVVAGRNLPRRADGLAVAFTLGTTTLSTIEEYADGTRLVLKVPAGLSTGTQTLRAANGRCNADADEGQSCSLTVNSTEAPTVTSVSPATITDIDTAITATGTNFRGRGRMYIGTHLCTVYWSSSTQLKCTLRTIPAAGASYTVTAFPDLEAATSASALTIGVTWGSAALSSARSVTTQGGAIATFKGIFAHTFGASQTTLVAESYVASTATATSLEGFEPTFAASCGGIVGRFLTSRDTSDYTATREFTGIATHGSLTVTFEAALIDTSSSTFDVTIDGTTHRVAGEVLCSSYSLCRYSSDECVTPVAVTVPHTAATASIKIQSANDIYWGMRSFAVTTGDAPTYTGAVNGSSLTFRSASPKVLSFTYPAGVVADTQTVDIAADSTAMPCDDCSGIEFTDAAAPIATAVYQGTHATSSVTWVSTDGIEHTSGTSPSLRRVRGSANSWSQGAYSVEAYPQHGITGVTFRFAAGHSECRMMFGLSYGVEDTASYGGINFAMYTDRGNVEVYEQGHRRYDGQNYAGLATASTMGVRCADADCTAIEYTVDGHVVYRSSQAVAFPLRLDSSFYENDCGVEDIAITRGTAAIATYPVWIAGNFDATHDRDSTVTIDGSACAVVAVQSGMIVCNAASTVANPARVIVTSPVRGVGDAAAVATSPILYGVNAEQVSALGGARVQIKGAGFSSPSFAVCDGAALVSATDAVTCTAASGTTGTSLTVNATGVACAGSECPALTYNADRDAALTSITPSTITDLTTEIVVAGTMPTTADITLQLSSAIACKPLPGKAFSTNFTCVLDRSVEVPAGTYSAVVSTPYGTSAASSVVVSLGALSVPSGAATTFGLLGGGKLRVTSSIGLSATGASIADAASNALCSAVAIDGSDLVCTLNSFGSAPTAPFTLTIGGQTATVPTAVTFASSANPTITAVAPTSVGCGDTVSLTGTNLATGMTVTIGGTVACEGVVAATDGNSATCTVAASHALAHGSSHAVALSSNAGAGTSSVTVAARLAVCSVGSAVTSTGLTVEVTASGIDTGVTHNVFVGDAACTVTATAATTITCTAAQPAAFTGTFHGVTVATATSAAATLSSGFTYDASASPTVTGISPAAGTAAGGDEVTISGTKFDLDPQQNSVRIGTSRCYAISVASTQDSLVCVTEPHAVDAAAAVAVDVAGLGAASSSTTYAYQLEITAAALEAPAAAGAAVSVEGGVPLTLTVTGLPPQGTNVAVTVGYVAATITNYSETSVTIMVPPAPRDHSATPQIQPMQADYTLRSTQVGVIRLVASGVVAAVNDTEINVAYDTSATPRITAVSIAEATLTTPESPLVIDGTDFAATGNEVLLVDQRTGNATASCAITAESATQITCTLNATLFGRSRVVVRRPGVGYAYTARTCPSGSYLTCDGQCLTDADCRISQWGRNAGCDDLMELLFDETFCHSNGGTDNVNRPLRLDNGKAWNTNCPLYNCEGGDCNKTLSYAGRAPRISTCGADPNGHYVTLVPQITAIAGAKTSSVLGGQRFTVTGRGFAPADGLFITLGAGRARVVSASYTEAVVETLPLGHELANVSFALSMHGAAATCDAAVCGGFYFNLSTTPAVASVTMNHSDAQQRITVTGVGFAASGNEVTVGGASCTVETESATSVVCAPPTTLGVTTRYTYYDVLLRADDIGYANMPSSSSDRRVRYVPRVISVSPTAGSTEGGTLVTITGFGFSDAVNDDLYAWMNWCGIRIQSATPTTIVGVTTGCSSTRTARVRVHGEYSSCVDGGDCDFTFTSANTPTVTSHDVTTSSAGSLVTLTGDFKSSAVADFTVTVGDANCTSVAVTSTTTVACTAPANAVAGTHSVRVLVAGYGYASGLSSAQITYALSVTSITPASGSLGGGQTVTVSGTGFPAAAAHGMNVTLAGVNCSVVSSSGTSIVCTTGAATTAGAGDVTVFVSNDIAGATLSGAYTYDASLTATVSAISPSRGSTAGGTIITLTGTGLSTAHVVTISGVTCAQTTAQQSATTSTSYPCTTGAHTSELDFSTVVVAKGTEGNAQVAAGATYQYVDLWSRRTSWNGYPPPVANDSVVISEGQTIMLDYSPPKLILIVVQGHLVFDDTADLTLQAHYIVVHFGRMTIGTEAKPYAKRAVIRMFGDRLSPEIPLSGAKTLLVYKGRLDMHGTPRTTWTKLAATAAAGSNTIVVRGNVGWNVGEEIVVGPTNFEMLEAEPRFISTTSYDSSADTTTLTFSGALRFMHWGVNQCFGTTDPVCVDEAAEVMLLSRNILFTGDDTSYVNGFGATTMFRPLGQDENRTVRVSYVEFTKVGQKFMLGRYPVHFHIPGDANNSYIEGCAIHRSMQRAITIHGVNNATFRKNVVYDTLGHSIFWEDGSEKYNVAEDNVVFVTRVSTSSLNSDTTPANFWLTNPMNFLRRNVAGGATFYGFWISPMVPHATGPSGGSHICPQTQSLGVFEDNHAHSNGNYGLQVKPNWFPKRVQCQWSSGDAPATLRRFTSTKNHIHGINFMTIGAIELDGYVSADIGTTDIESSHVWNELVNAINDTVGVRNSVMIGYTSNQPYHRGAIRRGINMPRTDNYFIHNVTFVNMENENWAIEPFRRQKRMSLNYEWAWEFVTSQLRFINSPQRLRYRFQHHSIANDMDGTLAGQVGYQVVPSTPFFDNQPACTSVSTTNFNYPTYTCDPSFKIRRIGVARSESGGNQNWTIGGVSEIVYRLKGGYLVTVPINTAARIEWLAAEGPNTYTTYFNTRYMLPHEHMLITDAHKEARISMNASFNGVEPPMLSAPPTLAEGRNRSAWFYNYTENAVHALWHMPHRTLEVRAYRCPPEGCLTPGGPPPVNKSCEPFAVASSWASGVVPTYDVNVTYQDSICIDSSIATWPTVNIGSLTVGGRLEFRDEFCPADGATVRIHIDRWVHIKNGILSIGNATHPVTRCRVEIIFGRVNWDDRADVRRKSLLVWGARAFALEYGRIDIFGRVPATPVAHLSVTAPAGATTLVLDRAVDWAVGDTVAVAQTTRNVMFLEGDARTEETERVNITAIAADKRSVTISAPLRFSHMGDSMKRLDGQLYSIGAEVALLNRNVAIHGGHWDGEQVPYDHGWQFAIGCTPGNYAGCAGGSADENGYPMSSVRPGVVHIDGVEMRDVGVKSRRHGAVEIDGLRGNRQSVNFIRNSVVHRSFAVGMSLRDGSEPMRLDGNVVFDTQGDGIRVASINNNITRNLVMLGRVPEGFCASIYVPKNPDCWPALFRVTAHNTLINNTAASAVAIGYETEGTPCSDNVNMWRGNKVHSVRDALHVMDNPAVADYAWPTVSFTGPSGCRRVEGVVAYSNADHGVALWFTRGDRVQVNDIVSVDNPIGFSAAVVASQVDLGQTEMRLTLERSAFAGRWPGHGCRNSAYHCRKTKVDDGPWCRSFQNKAPRMGNIGVFETVFMSPHTPITFGEHYFMWHEPDGYAVVKAKATYRDLFFDHFDGADECGLKTVGIYQNPFSNDTHHQHTFSGIRYGDGIANGGEMWAKTTYGPIPGHLTHGLPPQPTYFMDYDNPRFGAFWPDAPNKIWMIDADGSLTRQPSGTGRVDVLSSQSLTRQSTWASMGGFNGVENVSSIGPVREGCTFNTQWNLYTCDSQRYKWLNLIVESTASDAWTRRVGPLVLCKGAGMTRANGDPICEEGIVDFSGGPLSHMQGHRMLQLRMSRFRFIVENGANYTLHYRGSPPSSTRFHLTNWEHTGLPESEIGVVINTRIYGAFSHSRLAVYVDGRKERPTFGFGYPHEFGLTWPGPTDRAGTHYHDKYVTPLLHRNVMSFSMRPEVVMDLRHEMIIQINMDLAIPMSEFFDRKDIFAIALANALGIDPTTVRFAKIVPGTTRRRQSSTTTVGLEVDGGNSTLNTMTATAISTRVDAVAADTAALSQTLNVTVLTVVASVIVVQDPEPAVSVVHNQDYLLYYVSHGANVTTFDTAAMQSHIVTQLIAALTNQTVANATDATTVLVGNNYTFPGTATTRFTLVFAYADESYNTVAMATANASAAALASGLAGYTYENHTYHANDVFVPSTSTASTPAATPSGVPTTTSDPTTPDTTAAPTVAVPVPTNSSDRGASGANADGGDTAMSLGLLVVVIVVPVVIVGAIVAGVVCMLRKTGKRFDDTELGKAEEHESYADKPKPSAEHKTAPFAGSPATKTVEAPAAAEPAAADRAVVGGDGNESAPSRAQSEKSLRESAISVDASNSLRHSTGAHSERRHSAVHVPEDE